MDDVIVGRSPTRHHQRSNKKLAQTNTLTSITSTLKLKLVIHITSNETNVVSKAIGKPPKHGLWDKKLACFTEVFEGVQHSTPRP